MKIVATYDYTDEQGRLLYQAVRCQPKDFRQRQPDGRGGWTWSVSEPPVRKVLYQLPKLLAADPNAWVYLPEGEKDVDNAATLGLLATCNVGGAGKWLAEYNQTLAGRKVCILPDNDDVGQEHARKVAENLVGVAAEVRIVNLPGLAAKGDVSDWIAQGGTADQLRRLTQIAAPYQPIFLCQEDSPKAKPQAQRQHEPDDLVERIKVQFSALDVFRYHGWVQEEQRERNGQIRLLGHGGLIVGDPNDAATRWQWYSHGDQAGGDQIDAWAHCTRRQRDIDFMDILHDMAAAAGVIIPVKTYSAAASDPDLPHQLAAYRTWLTSPQAIIDFKRDGFKNAERARKLLDAILQRCEQAQAKRIQPGYGYLAQASGIARGGLGAYLARFFSAGYLELYPGEDGSATAIELNIPVCHYLNSIELGGVQVVTNWNLYREYRPDELFFNNHHVYIATHTQADLPPLGDNGLPALLKLADGPCTIQELADELGHSYRAMARTLQRYVEHGLVEVQVGERNRKTYSLVAAWRAILQANRPRTTTYGVALFRRVDALQSRVKYLRSKGEDEKADKVQAEYERMRRLANKVKADAGIIAYRFVRKDKEAERRRRLKRAELAGERAERKATERKEAAAYATEGSRWRRKEYAESRTEAEINWQDFNIWATAEHGPGWWLTRDQTDVLGQYKLYQLVGDYIPTIHWDGAA